VYKFEFPYSLALGNLYKMKHNHLDSNISQKLMTQQTNSYFIWVVPFGMSDLKNGRNIKSRRILFEETHIDPSSCTF